ncbi:penicillin-binding protein activator [Hydrogenovibrio sp. 3SP14C1]|uniref:penicillin-binding protein activator n=1 Tax=Hydrogenovibrio sp. 3SP14C1 TaxID=3038774 RepID=UPI002416DC46|nr:penicillin-binding protein activator [Hydrogenovibrio sp. 3SP14C1]MDG4812260.1 penicillin-binding protein activator [Hydrogenovibrio sp. 3SP14C1]
MFKQITLIFAVFTVVLLTGCSTTPKQSERLKEIQRGFLDALPKIPSQLNYLESSIQDAKNDQAWQEYIDLSRDLWQEVDDANQLAIEFQVWSTFKNLPQTTLQRLKNNADNNADLQNWLRLVEATQQKAIWQKQALRDLREFYPTALYVEHLLPELQNKLNQPTPIKNIAVLLPFSGEYANISLQIRNGILKNHFSNQSTTHIRFYDSSDLSELKQTYSTAIHQGAEWVIGPLRKEAIETLAPLKPENLLALNQVNDPNIKQFNFKSDSEAFQITQQLQYHDFKRIGILTSTASSDTNLAQHILYNWNEMENNHAVLKTYPTRRPNLREALGSVINEPESEARKNNLKWLFKETIHFTPRLRQDLDSIILIGSTERLAVFKPQFKFFALNLPTYGSSKLTPAQLKQTPPNKDLSHLIFPTMTAAMKETPLKTPFEAFGWDSLTVVLNQQDLAPGVCLNSGMTGRLSMQDNIIDHTFIWAQYDRYGYITEAPPYVPPQPIEEEQEPVTPETDAEANSTEMME